MRFFDIHVSVEVTIIFYNLLNTWLLLLIDLYILITNLPKTDVLYLWIWLLYLVSINSQPAGYHRSSRTIYVFWPLYCLYKLLQKNILLQGQQITEFKTIDTKNSSTAYVVMYKLIT